MSFGRKYADHLHTGISGHIGRIDDPKRGFVPGNEK
jgi:hypothetical protein